MDYNKKILLVDEIDKYKSLLAERKIGLFTPNELRSRYNIDLHTLYDSMNRACLLISFVGTNLIFIHCVCHHSIVKPISIVELLTSFL